MGCSFPSERIEQTIHFHGHQCPGLAIGLRVAEIVGIRFTDTLPQNLVCVTETDMCAVDAIQYVTGCTFGKGNLIHRDYGKAAFSFFDRKSRAGIRIVFAPGHKEGRQEMEDLMAKQADGTIGPDGQERLNMLRKNWESYIMNASLEELFQLTELQQGPPRPARVLESLTCAACSESTMESRTRRYNGQTLCIPCFEGIEQKY